MLYSDRLYSQHILHPYCTAVLLTTTLSDAVQWQFVFTAHSTTLPYSCPAHYDTVWCWTLTVFIHSTFYNLTVQLSCSLRHCLMLNIDSFYSQRILQPYCTAVLLTTTLSDAVQWLFVFTAHSTTILYSCPAHYDSVWWCTVTVCIHSTFYNLTVQLSCSLRHCLNLYSDSLYSQHILQPYCTAVLLTMTLSDAVHWQFVFTAHSTTLLYSCPAHYDTVWCCILTVCIHSTFYNLTVELSDAVHWQLLKCLQTVAYMLCTV